MSVVSKLHEIISIIVGGATLTCGATQMPKTSPTAQPIESNAAIHARCIIAATLANAVLVRQDKVIDQQEAISTYKSMLNAVNGIEIFMP